MNAMAGERGHFESRLGFILAAAGSASGIFISLFAGWVVFPRLMDASQGGIDEDFRWAGVWQIICRYFAPVAITWTLINGL